MQKSPNIRYLVILWRRGLACQSNLRHGCPGRRTGGRRAASPPIPHREHAPAFSDWRSNAEDAIGANWTAATNRFSIGEIFGIERPLYWNESGRNGSWGMKQSPTRSQGNRSTLKAKPSSMWGLTPLPFLFPLPSSSSCPTPAVAQKVPPLVPPRFPPDRPDRRYFIRKLLFIICLQ